MTPVEDKMVGGPKRMLSSVIRSLRLSTTVLESEDDRELDKVANSWPEYKTLISRFRAYEDCVLGLSAGTKNHAQMRELLHLELLVGAELESTPRLIPKERKRTNWNALQYGRLCSMLCLYWFIDVLANLADIGHRLSSARVESESRAFEGLPYYRQLADWPAFMMRFKDVIRRDVSNRSCHWSQSDSPCWKLLQYLNANAYQSARSHIGTNLTVAAMHLAFLKEYCSPVGILPDLPDQIHEDLLKDAAPDVKIFLTELAQVAEFFVTSRTRTAKGGQSLASFRAPLQLALAVSPLYLLCHTVLCKKIWNRSLILRAAESMHNWKPVALIQTEVCVWSVLLAMANGTLDPSDALSKLDADLPWALIESVNGETDRLWFASGWLPIYLQVEVMISPCIDIVGANPSGGNEHSPVISTGSLSLIDPANEQSTHALSLDRMPGKTLFLCSSIRFNVRSFADESPSCTNVNFNDENVSKGNSSTSLHQGCGQSKSDVKVDTFPKNDIQDVHGAKRLHESSYNSDLERLSAERTSAWTISNASSNALHAESTSEGLAVFSVSSDTAEEGRAAEDLSEEDSMDDEEDYCASQSVQDIAITSLRRSSRIQRLVGDPECGNDDVTICKQVPLFLAESSATTSPGPQTLGMLSTASDLVRDLQDQHSVNRGYDVNALVNATITSLSNVATSKVEDLVIKDVHCMFQRMRVCSDRSFQAYDARGKPFRIKPESHHQVTLTKLKKVLGAIEESYVCGKPMHLDDNERSVIAIRTYEEFVRLSDLDLHDILTRKNLVVTGASRLSSSTEEDNISALYPLHNPILVKDHSFALVAENESSVDINTTQVSGELDDWSFALDIETAPLTRLASLTEVIQESRETSGKILEVPHIPLSLQDPSSSLHSSNVQAWYYTQGRQRPPSSEIFPSTDVRWASVATQHAVTFFRFPPHGMHCYSSVFSGRHMWIFMHSQNPDATEIDERQRPRLSGSRKLEAIVLEAGDILFVRADQAFATYACQTTILRGEYFYSASLMRGTACGLYRGFVTGGGGLEQLTMGSSELRRRLVDFIRMGFLERSLTYSDGGPSSLPRVQDFSGLQELLSLCNIHILANVLDPRTYGTPWSTSCRYDAELDVVDVTTSVWATISVYERLAMVHARGIALELLDWVRYSCHIVSPEGQLVEDFPTQYLLGHMSTLLSYKAEYQSSAIRGFPNCDYAAIHRQIMNVLTCDNRLHSRWTVPQTVDVFKSQEESCYTVTWAEGPFKPVSYSDLLIKGATALDLEYFRSRGISLGRTAGVLRRVHESSDEVYQRPRKRARMERAVETSVS
ncbi:hypothetical protein CVT26_005516 [Gymnopilus dilepis]|uniref:Uncharacterized protein n=1 Tax=Gymnopilus dilepis TaxID=231916 RepID=A0A409W810_9AGAR|nr:hypothetical protein CVT26_005516 [Gymnopilus dilepis]